MQKQVVRFERDTTIKDDICYKEGFKLITSGVSCNNCRVHILTDRFLSKRFQQKVMNDFREFPMGTYPYVMIVDTSLCNLRCRACYSWIYWRPEARAKATVVDEKILAKQFRCKIEKLHEEELIAKKSRVADKTKRPFSRLRISGGEPLFDSNEPSGNSIKFWLSFLKNLDNEIGDLIKENKIILKSEKEWMDMSPADRIECFPVFLESDNSKIRIRFDTNGELFSAHEFTEKFIGGIYDLKLKNIKIDLTFSVKGTNSYEVDWFINQNSHFDEGKVNIDEPLEKHPQWISINNIVEVIKSRESKEVLSQSSENIISETYFNACGEVSLTIEGGIMNNFKERLFLYNKNSLDWVKFAAKLEKKGLHLSETENCIYLGQFPTGTGWRYINTGNYELRFKCPHHNKKPFLSYSKKDHSITGSLKHRQLIRYNDGNIKHFAARIKIQNKMIGQKCKYSDCICDYWIEIVPVN